MRHTFILICLAALLLSSGVLLANGKDSALLHWQFDQQRINDQEIRISFRARLDKGILLYDLAKTDSELLYSGISFDSSFQTRLRGKISAAFKPELAKDSALQTSVRFFRDSVCWEQILHAGLQDSFVVKGSISYLLNKAGSYLPGEKAFAIFVEPVKQPGLQQEADAKAGLGWIFLMAFAGGLLALLTPCVYSMIPVTVSFFTKRSQSRKQGIRNAVYYSASIIVIFTLLGFLVTLVFGPAALNNLATNWIANLLFFLVFIIFGFSFLGAFEIGLPASWAGKTDSQAGLSSLVGIFFMALTLVIVSFSCTGPIIGNLLVLAARGSYWGPLTGMFGFSLALALPFALFAFFPARLNVLGKAGGWLNAVKVTLGFLELALAMKFLSNADLSQGWRLLDREVFIAIWVVLFALLGLYLLGLLRFRHDDALPSNDFGLPHLSVPRFMLAASSLIFALYMMPGMWGAPLKAISAFVPPMGTQDFVANASTLQTGGENHTAEALMPRKYAETMTLYEPEVVTRYGLLTYFDYAEALEAARKAHKPLMLDFTGINCVNCRKMEGQVWSDPRVMERLKNNFVIVSLYVDVHQIDLPPAEQYYSALLDKQVTTLGDKNADLQVTRFGSNTQPYYFFIDGNEQKLVPTGYGYDPDVEKFIQWLDKVSEAYKKS